MTDTAIRIHAVVDGEAHPLDTHERMRRWFAWPSDDADYFVAHAGRTYEFDGIPGCEPRNPSDLVSKALDRIPGNAPRSPRADWSLLDDMTRGQCAWLAIELAALTGGDVVACGIDNGSTRDLDWFMHAGVLIGDHVHCALGRSTPEDWTSGIVRGAGPRRFEHVHPMRLARRQVRPLSPCVAATLPDVAALIATLIKPDEPLPMAMRVRNRYMPTNRQQGRPHAA